MPPSKSTRSPLPEAAPEAAAVPAAAPEAGNGENSSPLRYEGAAADQLRADLEELARFRQAERDRQRAAELEREAQAERERAQEELAERMRQAAQLREEQRKGRRFLQVLLAGLTAQDPAGAWRAELDQVRVQLGEAEQLGGQLVDLVEAGGQEAELEAVRERLGQVSEAAQLALQELASRIGEEPAPPAAAGARSPLPALELAPALAVHQDPRRGTVIEVQEPPPAPAVALNVAQAAAARPAGQAQVLEQRGAPAPLTPDTVRPPSDRISTVIQAVASDHYAPGTAWGPAAVVHATPAYADLDQVGSRLGLPQLAAPPPVPAAAVRPAPPGQLLRPEPIQALPPAGALAPSSPPPGASGAPPAAPPAQPAQPPAAPAAGALAGHLDAVNAAIMNLQRAGLQLPEDHPARALVVEGGQAGRTWAANVARSLAGQS